MDKAGRKFLLSLILKNSGTQILAPISLWCIQSSINALSPSQTTDTIACSAQDFGTYLGVDRRTIDKHANSTSAFKDLKPEIKKKQTASNRWEAREVFCSNIECTKQTHIYFMFLFYLCFETCRTGL